MDRVKVKKIDTDDELKAAFAIRKKVFVEEQKVDSREEYDAFDRSAVHFLAIVDGTPAGAARWRQTEKGYKLERFAVLKEFRGSGVGSALVRNVLEDLPEDNAPVYLNAQLEACGLYRKFGFMEDGAHFMEAGIRHCRMILPQRLR